MSERETPPDYTRARSSALQRLAGAGDAAATLELQRRGIDAVPLVDVTTMSELDLRDHVRRWHDGRMPEDRDRSFDLARRALAELQVRYRVDARRHARAPSGTSTAPTPPPDPPWEAPRPPRGRSWQRPTSSKLYPDPRWQPPSPETVESWRRAFASARAAGEPQRASE